MTNLTNFPTRITTFLIVPYFIQILISHVLIIKLMINLFFNCSSKTDWYSFVNNKEILNYPIKFLMNGMYQQLAENRDERFRKKQKD